MKNSHSTLPHFLLAATIVLAVTGCQARSPMESHISDASVQVCYIPISASTYRPVTVSNFDKSCLMLTGLGVDVWRSFEVMLARATPSQFDNEVVRVRIDFGERRLFINKLGEVLEGEKKVRLQASDLKEFERILGKKHDTLYR